MKYALLWAVALVTTACTPSIEDQNSDSDITMTPTDDVALFAPGRVSTGNAERDLALTADGTELFYTLSTPDNATRAIIHMKRTSEGWSDPEVASFSGQFMDIEPFVAPDDQRLYFASKRPLTVGDSTNDYNLWYVDRIDRGWSDPVALPAVINGDGDEYYPSVASNGNLYFTASREDSKGLEDIYVSRWVEENFTAAESLDTAVNSKGYEYNAFISPDESFLIFGSFGRPDGLGGGDMYISYRDGSGAWKAATHLPAPINSEKLDYCPFVHSESQTFFFTSNRSTSRTSEILKYEDILKMSGDPVNGQGDIFFVKASVLGPQ